VEKYFSKLLRRGQVERASRQLVCLLLQSQQAFTELATLDGEERRVQQHSIALHPVEDTACRQLDSLVNVRKLGVARDLGVKHAMQLQGDVGVFGQVFGRTLDRHLVKVYLRGTATRDVAIRDRFEIEVARRETRQVVRPVRLQHVGLQQRIL